MSRDRKIITRVIVFLLLIVLGAIVNVAVAWGCALWSGQLLGGAMDVERAPGYQNWWKDNAPEAFPIKASQTIRGSNRVGTDYLMMEAPSKRWSDAIAYNAFRWRSGLPARSFERSYWMDLDTGASGSRHALNLDPGNKRARVLPLRPLWPGFAINTVFYTGILWLLFAAPFALRRRRRIKRGLCPACAYPVGDSTVCTECGRPL